MGRIWGPIGHPWKQCQHLPRIGFSLMLIFSKQSESPWILPCFLRFSSSGWDLFKCRRELQVTRPSPRYPGCLEFGLGSRLQPMGWVQIRLHSHHEPGKLSGKSSCKHIHGKVGWGGGGNKRHLFDKYSSRFVYVPGTADRVMGKKEGLSSLSL